MSKQNSPQQKMLHREIRELRKAGGTPYTPQINLVNYLVSRKLVRTKRAAREALIEGKAKSDGVIIGRDVATYKNVQGKTKVETIALHLVPKHLMEKFSFDG